MPKEPFAGREPHFDPSDPPGDGDINHATKGSKTNLSPNAASPLNPANHLVETASMKWWKGFWTMPGKQGSLLGWPARVFILTQVVSGIPLVPYALLHWHTGDVLRFACFLGVALSASLFKVRLPGIQATMSANFLFILVGILDLSYPETLLMGCLGGLVQSLWQAKPRPRLIQILFNFANLAISITAADLIFHSNFAHNLGLRWPLLLAAASTTYFAMNTISVRGSVTASSDTVHPEAAGASVKIAGPPVTPGPAASVTSQRSPLAVAVTVVCPVPSTGASNTTWRDGFMPGTP